MGHHSPKLGQLSLTRQFRQMSAGERISQWLRAKHPAKTAEAVEAATHGAVSVETARKIITRQSAPAFATLEALIAAYGPEFLAAALPRCPQWLVDAAERTELAEINAEQVRLEARLTALRGAP